MWSALTFALWVGGIVMLGAQPAIGAAMMAGGMFAACKITTADEDRFMASIFCLGVLGMVLAVVVGQASPLYN